MEQYELKRNKNDDGKWCLLLDFWIGFSVSQLVTVCVVEQGWHLHHCSGRHARPQRACSERAPPCLTVCLLCLRLPSRDRDTFLPGDQVSMHFDMELELSLAGDAGDDASSFLLLSSASASAPEDGKVSASASGASAASSWASVGSQSHSQSQSAGAASPGKQQLLLSPGRARVRPAQPKHR